MRKSLPCLTLLVVVLFGLTSLPTSSAARKSQRRGIAKPERGKRYRLSKQHGPWMIMVTTFNPVPEEFRSEGMTPIEAADELVYELRMKGIPAYTVFQDEVIRDNQSTGRGNSGKIQQVSHSDEQQGIAVIAGNYKAADSRSARKTVAYVKKFHPKFLRSEEAKVDRPGMSLRKLKNGGLYRKTQGRPGPLSGAHLTMNPLLSPEEARQSKIRPLLLKLNSGTDHSLLESQGKFTLVVASFYGKSVTLKDSQKLSKKEKDFKVSNTLDKAALDAWELTQALRNRTIEAYVWHDQHRSVVTVGSFNSLNDPRIPKAIETYRAKTRINPANGAQMLTAEALTIPYNIQPGVEPKKKWIFDPTPRVMSVPTL